MDLNFEQKLAEFDNESKGLKTIVGLFFHSYNPDGEIEWQGQVIGTQAGGYLIVTLFDWICGMNLTCKMIPLSLGEQWTFYKTSEEMKSAYDNMPHKSQEQRDRLLAETAKDVREIKDLVQ